MLVVHNIPPEYDGNSKILILGSFPSVKSREQEFFYGHGKNRFWKVISAVFCDKEPLSIEDKKAFLQKHKIALWDVIKSCEITGSADSSIKNVCPNDLRLILNNSAVNKIFINGKTAYKYYKKFNENIYNIQAICLPSTSPANAKASLNLLIKEWSIIK